MKIKIITDGSSDLSRELADTYQIEVVPLSVHFENETHTSELESETFYRKMKEESQLPKTSSPSPYEFLEIYKKAAEEVEAILVLCVTSQLSSTYHHALMAKDMFYEQGYTTSVEILDSKTASMGLGILALKASILAKTETFNQLVEKMKNQIKEVKTYFTLDTLENVIKGGRLDRITGAVASMLNIKLLMRASEQGTVEVLERLRGTQKALKRLLEKVGENWQDSDKKLLAVAHSNCEAKAKEFLQEILKKYPFEQVVVTSMGPVIGSYAGEGGILVAY